MGGKSGAGMSGAPHGGKAGGGENGGHAGISGARGDMAGTEPGTHAGEGGEAASEDAGAAGSATGTSGAAGSSTEGPEPIRVHGTVVDARMKPLGGAMIRVGGASIETDGSGNFELDGVVPPYDVVAIATLSPAFSAVVVYQGLTRSDPTVQVQDAWGMPTEYKAHLDGELLGGDGSPDPPGYWHTSALTSSVAFIQNYASSGDMSGSNSFSLGPYWYDHDSINGTLLGLQWQGTQKEPTLFTGFASMPVGLNAGESKEGLALTLDTNIETAHLSGTAAVPTGYSAPTASWFLTLDANTNMFIAEDTLEEPFSIAMPKVSGGSVAIQVWSGISGVGSSWVALTDLQPDANVGEVVVPTIPVPQDPFDGAVGVKPDAHFAWAESNLPIYEVFVSFTGSSLPSITPFYRILTAAREISIPDLSDMGLEWPKEAEGRWAVRSIGPFPSVDDAASRKGYVTDVVRAESSWPQPPSVSMATATTEGYPTSFTTAP